MSNPKDFFAKQIRTTQIIASGSHGHVGDPWTPGLMIYSASVAPDFEGTIPDSMLSDPGVGSHVGSEGLLVGTDVYLFVSGTQGSDGRWDLPDDHDPAVVLFGGDVVISGTLYAERQVIEVDLAQEGDLLLSGNFRAQDQQYPGPGWVRFVGPTSSGNFNILSLDSSNLRAGFGTNNPDNPVHIMGASATTGLVADSTFDPTNETDHPLKIQGLYQYDPSEFGGSAARNLVIDENGVVKYGFTTIGFPCEENACDGTPDNTFTDGLFVDWDENTILGCALDRINEVLGQLAPPPAPLANCLGNIRAGATHAFSVEPGTLAPFIPVKISDNNVGQWDEQVLATTSLVPVGMMPAVGLDGLFEYSEFVYPDPEDIRGATLPTEAEFDIQSGAMWGDPSGATGPWLRMRINFDDPENGPGGINHPQAAFGRGDQGILKLYVNGIEIDTHDLTDLTSHGVGEASGLSVGPAEPAHFDTGEELCTYFHRTYGFAKVAPGDMRDGWNWAHVIHSDPTLGDIVTNYVTWIIDDSVDEPTVTGTISRDSVTLGRWLSGVQYHVAGSINYDYNIQNAYKRFYSPDGDAISWNVLNLDARPAESIPAGPASTSDNISDIITFNITDPDLPSQWLLGDSVSVSTNVKHPFDDTNFGPNSPWGPGGWTPCIAQGLDTDVEYLMYNPTLGDEVLIERFRTEDFRLVPDSYNLQGDIAGGTWDPQENIESGAGLHIDGLMCFNDRLISAHKTDTAGGAPNIIEGDFSTLSNGPALNVDYSGAGYAAGYKTFIRKFNNNTGGSDAEWNVLLTGDCEIVPTGAGGTNNLLTNSKEVHILFKFPENGSGSGTGWMDLAKTFVAGSWSDGDGLHKGTFNPNIGATAITNLASIGTRSVLAGNDILIKVIAKRSWTGHLSQIEVSW